MGESLKREDARTFLKEVGSPHYKTLAGFETWAKGYAGGNKAYLSRVVACLQEMNSGGSRVFGLGDSEIEQILDKTIPAEVS